MAEREGPPLAEGEAPEASKPEGLVEGAVEAVEGFLEGGKGDGDGEREPAGEEEGDAGEVRFSGCHLI